MLDQESRDNPTPALQFPSLELPRLVTVHLEIGASAHEKTVAESAALLCNRQCASSNTPPDDPAEERTADSPEKVHNFRRLGRAPVTTRPCTR